MFDAKRVVFRGRDVCEIESFTIMDVGPTEVVVRNQVSLISPGTELSILRGLHHDFSSPSPDSWAKYPFYPGYAAVGEIVEVGDEVSGLAAGDVVVHNGGHSTHAVVEGSFCHVLPTRMKPEDAVFLSLVEIAATSLHRAPVSFGGQVLMSGLGLVGLLAARLYILAGGRVTAADPIAERLDRARALGAQAVIDLSKHPLAQYEGFGEGGAPELIVEASGSEASIRDCLRVAPSGGRVVLLGSPRAPMQIDLYSDVHAKGATVIGAHMNTVPPEIRERESALLLEQCQGPLRLDEIRTNVLPFAEAPSVYQRISESPAQYLGVVLRY